MKVFFSFLFSVIYLISFGQESFLKLKQDLEHKIMYSDFQNALSLINSNKGRFAETENIDLEIMKIKILTEFGLYDESFKLSQNIISNNKLTKEQQLKTFVERALIFEINNDSISCLQELNKAEKIFIQNPELKNKNYTNFLIRKSSYYRVNGHKKKAYELALQAKKYAEQAKDEVNMPVVEFILGFGNRKTNASKELEHYLRALYLYKKLNHNEAAISMYNNISYYYTWKKEYDIANIYSDSTIAMSSQSKVLNYKAKIFKIKSDIMEAQNKTDSAFYYYKIASDIYKKYYSEQREIKVNELKIAYDFEKVKSEKQLLKKNVEQTKILNIALFIFLIVLGFFLWQILKNKKEIEKQKHEIIENNSALKTSLEEKQFLVQELNHRVKNNLAVILSLIDFQKDQTKNEADNNRFEDLHKRIKTIMIAHELYSYSVNLNDNALVDAKNYIDKIFETHQNSTIRKFEYNLNIIPIQFNVDKILSIGLMLNELVTNSIKHAVTDNQELFLQLKLNVNKDNKVEMNYLDNGTVFNFEKNNDSLGLIIIEAMIKQLKGEYVRENAHFKIVFPYDTK